MGAVIGGRRGSQFESLAAIELPDDDEVREAFDVRETGFELRQDLQHAVGIVFRAETFGNIAGVFVGTAHESDGARGEHGLGSLIRINTQKIPAQASLDGAPSGLTACADLYFSDDMSITKRYFTSLFAKRSYA